MFKVKSQKPEMINKTFRLPLELVQTLQVIAQNKEVSLNSLVQQCCEYAIEHLEEEQPGFKIVYIRKKRKKNEKSF